MTEFETLHAELTRPALEERHGRTVVYGRGECGVEVVSISRLYRLAGITELGDPLGQFHDEEIKADALILGGVRITPRAGDWISTDGGSSRAFTVAPPEKDGFVFEKTAGGTMLRAHVKE